MSTASAASSPHHLHPGLARAAAHGNLEVEKQKACGCPEPPTPTPFAKVGETGSGPAAAPQLPVRKKGKEEKGAVGPGVVGSPRSRGGVCLELVLRVYVRGLRPRTPASVARVGTEKAPPSPRIETGKRKRL